MRRVVVISRMIRMIEGWERGLQYGVVEGVTFNFKLSSSFSYYPHLPFYVLPLHLS